MATKGSQYITFRDINSGRLPNGLLDKDVVELTARENPAIQDVFWKECSKGREDITTIRTGIPEAAFRAYYEGVQGSKSSKKQVANSCGTVSTMVKFDARLYDESKDKAAFLLDEVEEHAEAMGQGAATALFYGDIKDNPKGINGISKTFSLTAATSSDQDVAAYYGLNASRSSNATTAALRSIFMVGWGKKSAHGIYPEGTSMGLQRGKLDFVYADDGTSKTMRWGIQEMNWNIGLNIRDFRYCGRIANIESETAFAASGVPDYVELLQRLTCRVKQEGVTTSLYMSRIVWEIMTVQFYRKTMGNAVKYADLGQKVPASLMGVSVGVCDALNVNESFVSAAT
jgi:hypothetical protein